ncbi:hypothetical protein OQH61_00085 [Helicobacter sp. MIT 21-1697]|uniref:hypothetical protein n=1 Tax=Helicobacter sp. MIT 21-1697 TaxID=2993733 RepID=UPI00224B64D7|nr:hypothetical protein [Helicobacter sp. MIT 21-1697]MCX2716138.1 hypothetical protein [Helicobacter sp. MIT 21-1697]
MVGGIAEGNYNDKEAVNKVTQWLQKWKQLQEDKAHSLNDNEWSDEMKNLSRALDEYESNIDAILDMLAKSKR